MRPVFVCIRCVFPAPTLLALTACIASPDPGSGSNNAPDAFETDTSTPLI